MNQSVTVIPGKGIHSTDGKKGIMSCTTQFLHRLLYGIGIKPDKGSYDFHIFELSPLGCKVLEACAEYDPEWGTNFLDTMRKIINRMTDRLMRLYIPPKTEKQRMAGSREFLIF